MNTFLLYVVTAIAEISGCYFPYRWLKEGGSTWLLVPGAISLALFAIGRFLSLDRLIETPDLPHAAI